MNSIKQRRIILIVLTLSLFSFACQLSTATIPSVQEVDKETIVADIVATIEAQPNDLAIIDNAGALTAVTNSTLPPVELQSTLIDLYAQANPAVVHIFVYDESGFLGSGTGFVIDGDGHIVTNSHVVENGQALEVVFSTGGRN